MLKYLLGHYLQKQKVMGWILLIWKSEIQNAPNRKPFECSHGVMSTCVDVKLLGTLK